MDGEILINPNQRLNQASVFQYFGIILFKQTSLTFFKFPDFCVPDILETNKVRNLKQTQKGTHIFHV